MHVGSARNHQKPTDRKGLSFLTSSTRQMVHAINTYHPTPAQKTKSLRRNSMSHPIPETGSIPMDQRYRFLPIRRCSALHRPRRWRSSGLKRAGISPTCRWWLCGSSRGRVSSAITAGQSARLVRRESSRVPVLLIQPPPVLSLQGCIHRNAFSLLAATKILRHGRKTKSPASRSGCPDSLRVDAGFPPKSLRMQRRF